MPSIGEKVMTSFGEGIVSQVDVLNRKFIVMVNGEYKEIKIDEESIK